MDDLPPVEPVVTPAVITSEDLYAAFSGLAEGHYTVRSLLPRYVAWASRNNKPEPTAKTLGEALWHRARLERRRVHGNVSAWFISKEALKR